MALESIEALAVGTRLSESHCHPPRETRWSDKCVSEILTSGSPPEKEACGWRTSKWVLWFSRVKGWRLHNAVEQVSNIEDQQELHDSRAQARSRLTTPAARMARIGMGQRRHPVRGCTCMLLTCDPSQGRGWCWEARRFEASEKGKAPAELMRANVRASERAAGSAAAEPQVASACD
jgi:hypothetical protein